MDAVDRVQAAHKAARAGRVHEACELVDTLRRDAQSDPVLATCVRMLDAFTGRAPIGSVVDVIQAHRRGLPYQCVEDFLADTVSFARFQYEGARVWAPNQLAWARGDFEQAHRECLKIADRFPSVVTGARQLTLRSGRALPRWTGKPARNIAVILDLGFGDQLLFARYVGALQQRCEHVSVVCSASVAPLIEQSYASVRVLTKARAAEALDGAEAYAPLWSLPYLTGAGFGEAAWARSVEAIDHGPGLHIGLVWNGDVKNPFDSVRSVPIALLAPLLEVPGITWQSLQVGSKAAECPAGVINHAPAIKSFLDTARIVAGLSLTITVDSSVANLCGSLGVPVWTLVDTSPDWRWVNASWFPSGRVFRQARAGEWLAVIQRVRDALIRWRDEQAERRRSSLREKVEQ